MLAKAAAAHEAGRMASNTVRAYASDFTMWAAWCQRHEFEALPADPQLVRLYVTDLAMQVREDGEPRLKVSSIERALAAIAAAHRDAGHGRGLVHHQAISTVMAGIRRSRSEPRRPKRPLLLDDVQTLLASMDRRWPAGVASARDELVILLGFGTAMRRSEVAPLTTSQVVLEPLDGLHVSIGASKTDPGGRGAILAVPYGSAPATCAPCAWIRWTRILDASQNADRAALMGHVIGSRTAHICRQVAPRLTNIPLFAPVTKDGIVVAGEAVSGSALNEMLKRRLDTAGYDPAPYGFHSLRAGFVTQARRNGADARSVRRQTRHGSDTMVDVYDRDHAPLRDNAVTILGL